jgi:hypothetical protein
VYQYLCQLVKEEVEYKRVIGGLIIQKVIYERLKTQNARTDYQSIYKSFETEDCFFKLVQFLTRNCMENAVLVKTIMTELEKYKTRQI